MDINTPIYIKAEEDKIAVMKQLVGVGRFPVDLRTNALEHLSKRYFSNVKNADSEFSINSDHNFHGGPFEAEIYWKEYLQEFKPKPKLNLYL